jgi:hypothetical protein
MSVSVTMGVMKPLLGKLATLAGDDYSKLNGVRKQASFLEKMELMDELDPVAKDWRDHVREMAYDMENCIDDFIRQFGGGDAKAVFIKKTVRRLKTLVLALEANERRVRYKFIFQK